MKPMLARPFGPRYSLYPCFTQPKLNGQRALYGQGFFQSRDEKLWKKGVLAHLVQELAEFWPDNLIADGELYVHGWKLQRIVGATAVNRTAPSDDTLQVEFHIFDIVDDRATFAERRIQLWNIEEAQLDGHPPKDRRVCFVSTCYALNAGKAEEHFSEYVADGYEGSMLRPPSGLYEIGKRSASLWKRKQWEDEEFICVGYTLGEGKASDGIGALILAVHGVDQLTREWRIEDIIDYATKNKTENFHVGTGFDDEERRFLLANPPIGKLIRVRYPYLSEDGIPQCPSFLAVMQ